MNWPIGIAYLVASLTFIAGLRMLGSPVTARNGNRIAAAGMAVAVIATFFVKGMNTGNFWFIGVAMALGAVAGIGSALKVKMTAMPQMVAIFNGMGGGAAALGSVLEYVHRTPDAGQAMTVGLSTAIGAVSFAGSIIAFAKLQEIMQGSAYQWRWTRFVNALLVVAILVVVIVLMTGHLTGNNATLALAGLLALGLILGLVLVVPIGGADMPVVISLMNSLTGVAVALAGFVLSNELLIVAGALVGASGTLLTLVMARAMNRPLSNVLFGGFGAVTAAGVELPVGATVRETSAEDTAYLMCYSRRVVIVPGYGLAVAQAQHQVRELSDLLMERGVEVKYAIHPVAGRMPGHMNVLLAEADVPYDQVYEMDAINGEFPSTDVVLVVGANDITNPGARDDPSSAIYGMPILNVDYAQQVIVLKRSMRPGFAGIDNPLYYNPKTAMLFGDARASVQKLVAAVKSVDKPRESKPPNEGKALQRA
jgi:proton-translocating NAD(P)+ transhydrogenase subunit beta